MSPLVSGSTPPGLQKAKNLSDVADAGTSRYNIHDPALTPVAACSNSVGNVSITSAPATLDGVTLNNGDLILLCVQTTQSQNGLWTFNGAGSALTRPTEFPSAGVVKGRTVMVEGGSYYNVATAWALVTPTAGITIDTSSQMWVPTATPYGLPVLSVANPLFSPAAVVACLIALGTSAIGINPSTSTVAPYVVGALISHPAFPYMATWVGAINPATTDTACAYNNSTAVTTTNSFTTDGVVAGMWCQGTGIPTNTYVASVNSATSLTLSNATTGGSLTGQTLTFGAVLQASSSPTSNVPLLAAATYTGGGAGVGGTCGVGQYGRQRFTDFCINNAIAALPASGGEVYVPSGSYAISNTIEIGNGYDIAVALSSSSSSINGASAWGGTRTDTGCSVSGSTINDASVTALDVGCPVTVGAKSGYVTSVVVGTSFVLSSAPTGGTNVTGATGTTAVVTSSFFAANASPLTCNPNPQQNSFAQNGGSFGAKLTGVNSGVGSLCTYSYADSTGFHGVSFTGGSTGTTGQPINGGDASTVVNSTTAGVALVGASGSQYNAVSGPAGQGPTLNWAGGNVVGPIIDILGPVNGWELRNLIVSGNGSMTSNAGGGIGLRVTAASGGLLDNVTVEKCPFAGVQTRAWPVAAFGEGGNNVANTYKRLSIYIMPNVNGAYGIDINGIGPTGVTGFDADTYLDDVELLLYAAGPGSGNTNTMIHFGNADCNRVRVREYTTLGGLGTTNLIMFDYTNDSGILGSNLIDLNNGPVTNFSASPNLIVNNGVPSSQATYFPNRIVGVGTEDQGAPLSLANCLFGWAASQNPTFASQTFTSGTGAQCTATSISVDNEAYITVTAGGTLTVAISEPWGNAGYTTIFNAITVVTGQTLTVRVPAGCYMKITSVTATYTTELQALI